MDADTDPRKPPATRGTAAPSQWGRGYTTQNGCLSDCGEGCIDVIPTIGSWVTAGVLEPTPDWEIVTQGAMRFGPVVSVYAYIKRIGAPITSGATGNIANTLIGYMHADYRPHPSQREGAMSTGTVGSLVSVSVLPDGKTEIGALVPNTSLNTGESTAIQGTWMAS